MTTIDRPCDALPFGLLPYEPGDFEAMHAAGTKTLSASGVPDLFGVGRHGRFARMAHALGSAPIEVTPSAVIDRGHRLEAVAIEMAIEADDSLEEGGQVCAYAGHPSIEGFFASPDGLTLEADHGARLIEVKTVAQSIWRSTWSEDEPPLAVQLQIQSQLACCPAAKGCLLVALVVGDYAFDLHTYAIWRHPGAIAKIERQVRDDLALIRAGQLPPPDEHPSSIAAIVQALDVDDGKEVVFEGDDAAEARRRADIFLQARADRLAAEHAEDAARRWFQARLGDAPRAWIGKAIAVEWLPRTRREKARAAQSTSYRAFSIKEFRE